MSKGFTLNKNIYFFRFLFFVLFYFLTYSFSFAQTITYTDSGGTNPRSSPPYAGGYTVHTFTATGTTNFTIPLNVTSIDYLVVGGGGGGGVGTGGGGGAGGMLVGNGSTTFYAGQSYTVTVGNGGMGGDAAPNWYGTNGSSSVFGSVTALGGGGGGGNDGAEAGRNGGSGGGAGGPPGGSSPGSGTAGQGYNGGSYGSIQGGGGGGAGEAGSTDSVGYGGDGLQSSISGTATWYAGGGGGRNTGGSSGGTGGGGGEGTNGTNGTGGGGGGYHPTRGDGGSGIVIVRYLTPDPNLAVLATSTATSSVTESSATFTGEVLSVGGSSITARGICYGTEHNPTTCVAEGGTGTGSFTMTLSNLATSTTYYYRSYAVNSYGTSTSGDSVFTTRGLTNSLMFDSGSNQYLNKTFGTATDAKKWTWSGWVKRSQLYASNNYQFLFVTAGSGAQGFLGFGLANNGDELTFGYGGYYRRYTNMQFRDPSAWYHIVLKVDTTDATEANRAIIYVNGVPASVVTPTTISQNDTTQLNQAVSTLIGNQTGQPYGRLDGYLSDVNFVDGQALTPSSFGQADSNTGNWIPKSYNGTYGTNGFHLKFNNASNLGQDISGNSNNWTTNGGMSTSSNVVTDTPLNNFATLNPVDPSGTAAVANGSLQIQTAAKGRKSTFFVSSGKWAWEIHFSSTMSGVAGIGIADASTNMDTWTGGDYVLYRADGGKQVNGSYGGAYGASYTNGDVIRVEYNADASTIEFFKQTGGSGSFVSQGTLAVTAGTYSPTAAIGATSGIIIFNFGQFPFLSTPTTGFKSLSTANLPTPTILKPNEHFDVATRTGTAASYIKNGLAFKPDFIWNKGRNGVTAHYLQDIVRGFGASKSLSTNTSNAEGTDGGAPTLHSLNPTIDGYTLSAGDSNLNTNGTTYVDWLWKAGNATTTNTAGSITSTISTNSIAGFTAGTFTIPSSYSNATVGHGLGSIPSFIIFRPTNVTSTWYVWHKSLASNQYLGLNLTDSTVTNSNLFNGQATTTFTLGNSSWFGGVSYPAVFYAFTEVPGYSKFGTYTGNGSTDGPFIYTGFKPRYVMLKVTNAASNWVIIDTERRIYNVNGTELQANSGVAEIAPGANSDNYIDMLSNGFKIRGIRGDYNNSGSPIIYAAFAESVLIPTVPSLPTLSSLTATSTTETTAVLGATVDTIGGSNLTARGICYGTTPTPTNCTAGTGTSTGVFTVSITGLATSTNYYYRAYATNASGTAYTSDSTFYTEGPSASLMFDSASNQYLNRTPTSNGSLTTWTWSGWVKRGKLGTGVDIFSAKLTGGSYPNTAIAFDTTDAIRIWSYTGGSFKINKYTSAVFRDPSAWMHISVAVDSTNATAEDRVKIYVNGVRQTSFSTNTNPSQNDTFDVNVSGNNHVLAGHAAGSYGYFDGYMYDVNFIDGQALDPSSFGQADSNTGNWIPKSYTGTYGTNGFHLKFNNASNLGQDVSGNSNNWTTNGGITSTNNQVTDTPLNNFATLNPLDKAASNITLSKGNLKAAFSTNYVAARSTMFVSSGSWYLECTAEDVTDNGYCGIATSTEPLSSGAGAVGTTAGWGIRWDVNSHETYHNGTYASAYSGTPADGDVYMMAFNIDTGKIWWGRNGTWFASGDPSAGTNPAYTDVSGLVSPMIGGGVSGSLGINFGQKAFAYTPPTGFKSLSTANLPTPTILKPNEHFDVVTYTGNGGTKTISTSFDSDFVWVKNRSAAYSNVLNDRVRGNDKTLVSDSNTAESALTGYMNFESLGSKQITFNYSGSGGPTGEWNYPGHNFVAWNWKAGGATTTNTNGAITSTVSANQTAGFSVAKFILNVANGASISWGHGLSSTPEMIIYKRTNSADSWLVYHTSVDTNPNNYYLTLNTTNAKSNVNGWSAPATTTVGGINNWQNGDTVVAYSFDEIPGYSKFGSYTGNGSADGPFVYTGFKPKYIMLKRTDASYHWYVWDSVRDTYNPYTHELLPSSSSAEYVNSPELDALSNGFKLRGTFADLNANGGTFIYAAFAESIMIPIVASSTSSSSSTITPPSDVTVTPGNGQATIDYTISPTSNFTEILVLRSNQDITDVPTDGVDYSVGNAIGSASVGCVDSTISTSTENVFDSCVATGLSNSTLYYFKVYSKDASGNYSLIQSVEGASTTPSVGATAVTVTSYRLRKDDGGEVTANYSHSENTPMNTGFISGDKRRIRFVVSNQTASLTKKRYQLEYAVTPCSSWTVLPKANEATNQHFRMDLSPFVPDNSTTTRSNGVTAPNGKTFVPGRIQTFNNLTYPIVLRENQFTEVEYSVRATNNVALNTSYCFRATGYGDAADFTYTNTPQISSLSTAYRYQGGGTGGSQLSSVSILKIEDPTVVATTSQTGGDQGGTAVSTSTTVEATSTPAEQQSTTTPTRKRGGGGATGYEPPKNNYAYSAVKDSLTFMNLFIKELANYQLKSTAINAYAYQECNLKTLVFIKTGECEHLDMYGDNKSKINLNILWSVFNKIEEIGK